MGRETCETPVRKVVRTGELLYSEDFTPYAYGFGDTGQMTPLLKQYTLGHAFVPPGIHAGGLRYHGVATQVAHLVHEGVMRAAAYHQNACLEAALQFAKCEGIIPAPESSHAIKAAIDEAIKCKESGETKTIKVPPELAYGTDPAQHELGGMWLFFTLTISASQ